MGEIKSWTRSKGWVTAEFEQHGGQIDAESREGLRLIYWNFSNPGDADMDEYIDECFEEILARHGA